MAFLFQYSYAQKVISAFTMDVPPEIDGIFEPEKWIGGANNSASCASVSLFQFQYGAIGSVVHVAIHPVLGFNSSMVRLVAIHHNQCG